MIEEPQWVTTPEGQTLAVRVRPGRAPWVVFLGGFRSDMEGTKAQHLAQWCAHTGQAFLRFDYSGHGLSQGSFAAGTISRWSAEAVGIIQTCVPGSCVLVGSSMGGWIMLHVAQALASQVVGLLGPNGAGKTTTFYMITGVLQPDQGNILLNQVEITRYPMHLRARSGLGYLAQERSIFRKLTVEENLLAVMELLRLGNEEKNKRLEQLLQEFGIQHVRKIKGYALSGGESRRTEIARALVLEPSIILLDEPFAGVDPIAVTDIQTIIRQLAKRNIGVLITDHNVRETFGIIDHGYIMNEGELLVNGPPEDLMRDEQARKIYLGETFSM